MFPGNSLEVLLSFGPEPLAVAWTRRIGGNFLRHMGANLVAVAKEMSGSGILGLRSPGEEGEERRGGSSKNWVKAYSLWSKSFLLYSRSTSFFLVKDWSEAPPHKPHTHTRTLSLHITEIALCWGGPKVRAPLAPVAS